MLPFSFKFDVGCDFFKNKKCFWTDKSNWKTLLVRSNKCTTRTTRTIDFAIPEVIGDNVCDSDYRKKTPF